MSYPLALQALVIEDEEAPKEAYARIFAKLSDEYTQLPFRPAPPLFAFSYEEGLAQFESSKMFHLVVLDLRLPRTRRLPPPEGVELGLDLFAKARHRTAFPIPALVIISGHVGKTEQTALQQTARDSFHYGQMLVKGDLDLLEKEIRGAVAEVIRYCAVGVHVRDGGVGRFPTISPEEEDLVRRCVLRTSGTIGLDLSWWDSELHQGSPATWTKVLLGRYILQEGQGGSRPQFVKLFPSTFADSVYSSARAIEKKLSHIKIASTLQGTSRAVLVTERVGGGLSRPIAVEEFLATPTDGSDIAKIVEQVGAQLNELGESSSQSATVKSLMWRFHDLERIRRQWEASGGPSLVREASADPISVFTELTADVKLVRFDEQSLVHGDLHIKNIALDRTRTGPSAYMFDSASSVGRSPKGRDSAILEVSAILHQDFTTDGVTELIDVLYNGSAKANPQASSGTHVTNTIRFVSEIREYVLNAGVDDVLYRTLVFDQALIQLGGLAFGVSGNKVRHPELMPLFVAAVTRWLVRLRRPAAGPTN